MTNAFLMVLQGKIDTRDLSADELETATKDAIYHELIYVFYDKIKKDPRQAQNLKSSYLFNFAKNASMLEEFKKISKSLSESSITIVPIKGISLLCGIYRKDYGLRSLVDIDILVKKEELNKVKNAMSVLGYKIQAFPFSENYYYKNHCHLPFKNRYSVEAHWALANPSPYKINLPLVWERLVSVKLDGYTLTLLSPEDELFSLILHLRRFNRPLSLKYIYDSCEIIKKSCGKLDWQYILKYAKLNRLNSSFYYALASIKIILGYPVPARTLNMFYPGVLRAFLLKCLINRSRHGVIETLRQSPVSGKYLYVFLRLLLYDRAIDFIKFIILIPIEEFARFYSIKFPSKKASIVYSLRFIIIPFYLLSMVFKDRR